MDYLITFPSRLNFATGCSVVRQFRNLPKADRYILDFSEMQYIEPFPMLHVASAFVNATDAWPGAKFEARSWATHSYARFMGFFRALGVESEREYEQAPDHENYLPINEIDLREVRADAQSHSVAPGKIIERKAGNVARTLCRQNYGPLWETLQYALREIIRNSVEHSFGDYVFYCGQYWPQAGRAEIAILDEGIGIARSLHNNPKLSLVNDLDALKLSVLPGISGVAYEGAEIDHDDEWANSGFGLYIVSEICRRGGSMTIISGDTGLEIGQVQQPVLGASHQGTALRLVIDTNKLRSIASSLALIVHEGEKIARDLNLGAAVASGASKRSFSS